jgi:SAM-dependent methyltransferase
VSGASDWEAEAGNWIRWARAPGHDSYWHYRDGFFEQLVPPPGRLTLEIGCGEGRVSRDLRDRGHRVVGIDASPTLLRHAREADVTGRYLIGDAMALPFTGASFDLVVAYNALMDVDDMPAAVGEAARVLRPGGRLCVSVTHPLNDAGTFEGREPDAAFIVRGSYLGDRRRYEGTFERDGLTITFRGWCYSLEDYARALEAAGLVIERIREPAASDAALAAGGEAGKRWRRVPLFLQMLARKG